MLLHAHVDGPHGGSEPTQTTTCLAAICHWIGAGRRDDAQDSLEHRQWTVQLTTLQTWLSLHSSRVNSLLLKFVSCTESSVQFYTFIMRPPVDYCFTVCGMQDTNGVKYIHRHVYDFQNSRPSQQWFHLVQVKLATMFQATN